MPRDIPLQQTALNLAKVAVELTDQIQALLMLHPLFQLLDLKANKLDHVDVVGDRVERVPDLLAKFGLLRDDDQGFLIGQIGAHVWIFDDDNLLRRLDRFPIDFELPRIARPKTSNAGF